MRVSGFGESPLTFVSIQHIIRVQIYNRRVKYCVIIHQYTDEYLSAL